MVRVHIGALIGSAFLIANASSAGAAVVAADTASDVAYDDGWATGDNGGTGFGAWALNKSLDNQGFFFIAKSGDNGDQDPSDTNTDIDTAGESFGLAVGDGGKVEAVRGFTGGNLDVGQTFSIAFDNGYIDSGSPVGFSLRAGTTDRFTFSFTGGQSNYQVNGATTSIPFTVDGLTIAVTLTGVDTYSAVIAPLAGGSQTVTGSLAGAGGLSGFAVFDNNAGYGGSASNDQFFNSIRVTGGVVPEPASMGLLGVVAVALLGRARRRHR